MKKLIFSSILLFALLAFFNTEASAQSIYFCEGVDSDGYPIESSETFNINSSGGFLYVLCRLPYTIECKSVRYEIYRNGEYDNTVYIDTDYDWQWFWKKITFYKSGNYTFYLYDCYGSNLGSGSVRINYN